MIRNILLAAAISMFCLFGALGSKDTKITLTCLDVAMITCALCVWRCAVLNRKINERHEGQRLFNEHMRRNLRNSNRFLS
jgi:hypothetical protein